MRRITGIGMRRRPLRYCPVSDAGFAMIASIGPSATTRPPFSPAYGPMSMTWSALVADRGPDGALAFVERRLRPRQLLRPVARLDRRHVRDVDDVAVADRDGDRLRLQPLAAAGRTGARRHVTLDFVADVVRVR